LERKELQLRESEEELVQILVSEALVVYREESEVGPYLKALQAAGVTVVPARADAVPALSGFDGLVLTGGTDVDPALYSETRQPDTEEPDRERDDVESALLSAALETDLPVLAICRGFQLMNVLHGGSLVQHLISSDHHRRRGGDRALPVHDISIVPGSMLYSIAAAREWRVNSRHHQGIKILGRGLMASATDPFDGLVEAMERPDKYFVLGVQWHPENQALVDSGQLRIFERFGAAMRRQPAQPERVLRGGE
jgi:gamma-glutamyl-gamma-aminobutyrate hydrolase PuuD